LELDICFDPSHNPKTIIQPLDKNFQLKIIFQPIIAELCNLG
jgi:hypothetical protein